MTREPLINSITSLRDLKRANARRLVIGKAQRMAKANRQVVLCKKRNTADVRFRARPLKIYKGLTARSALLVAAFRRAPACLQSCVSIANRAVSQRRNRIDQRFPQFVALLVVFCCSTGVRAVNVSEHPELLSLVETMVSTHDFSRDEVMEILSGAERRETVIEAMTKPAEGMPWHRYRKIFMTDSRVADGVRFWQTYRAELERAEQEFGVPAEMIIAIIGVESRYGEYRGAHLVLDSLVTLVVGYPRRSEFFSRELQEFLVLCREQGFKPGEISGSYAGAMGYPQFISSSYRAYAIDFNGDGKTDLINDPVDAIGSVANYFSRHGWRGGGGVVAVTEIDGGEYASLADNSLKPGLTGIDLENHAGTLPAGIERNQSIGVVTLEGEHGDIFRVTMENFYVITKYNRSVLYAMAVFELSEEIRRSL